ncbi:MAG: ABC transporter permease [Planctomycetes bacterium]|nr:ABC transporter permease [Planctomycetota bacterium]
MLIDRPLHTVWLALKNLGRHRLRSTLTTSGIILGVASVIVMLSVGEAARYEAIQQIKDLGATNVIVKSVKPMDDVDRIKQQGVLSYGLTHDDLQRIRDTIPSVISVVPMREFRKELRYLGRKLEGRVVAATPEFLEMNGLRLSRGRFITSMDDERYANVTVIGAESAETLFPFDDPIGRTIRIGESHYYLVIGVTERRAPSANIGSSLSAQDYNRDAYIPFATDRARFGELVTYQRGVSWEAEKLEMSQITVRVDREEDVRQTAQIIEGLLAQFHTEKDTAVTVPLDLLEKVEETQRIFTLVLGAIASISLVVGGIGIMNIMLATVTERTREIGIRRALGAKRRDITWQFLVETVTLSSAGGLLGVLVGVGFSYAVTHFFALRTIIRGWSPLVAFAVSVIVGLVFGTYPARRAAAMDPIEALRHE